MPPGLQRTKPTTATAFSEPSTANFPALMLIYPQPHRVRKKAGSKQESSLDNGGPIEYRTLPPTNSTLNRTVHDGPSAKPSNDEAVPDFKDGAYTKPDADGPPSDPLNTLPTALDSAAPIPGLALLPETSLLARPAAVPSHDAIRPPGGKLAPRKPPIRPHSNLGGIGLYEPAAAIPLNRGRDKPPKS